jgi:hypothetical protein
MKLNYFKDIIYRYQEHLMGVFMKIKSGMATLFFLSVVTLFCCNKNSDPESPDFIGKWQLSLQPIPNIIPDTMSLNLIIDANNTYTLTVIERTDKTLFSSEGTWETTTDSITLSGEACKMLDTSATPDTLEAVGASICSTPIVLSIPSDPTLWTIKTSSLEVPLSALPINSEQLVAVFSLVQTLQLTRILDK